MSPQHRIEELASTAGKFMHEAAVEGVHKHPGRASGASAPATAPDLCGLRPRGRHSGAAKGQTPVTSATVGQVPRADGRPVYSTAPSGLAAACLAAFQVASSILAQTVQPTRAW